MLIPMAILDKLPTVSSCRGWFICRGGGFPTEISCSSNVAASSAPALDPGERQRGGWRSIPYILLNELAEKLAAVGLSLNFITYLMGSYHMNQVMAASIINIVSGTACLTPLVGAFLSDAYFGRFWTIVFGSVSHLIASLLLIVTAACPSLRPPAGNAGASSGDLAFLLGALAMTTVAAGALRPCSYAFGTDQLVQQGNPAHDKQQTQSFFNWWLDHAAIVTESDVESDGSVNSSRPFWLCTVNEVEQLKAVVALAPIWMVNMLSTTVLSQHSAFNVPQARRMDRHIGSSGFNIPPASMSVFSSIALIIWMPFYDRVVVPKARKITGHPGGIKILHRIGIGFALSVVALIVSGLVEMRRRQLGQRHERLSALWLVPQQCLYGLGESFHAVGQLEFLYDQLPFNMRSVAGAVFWCSSGIGHYTGTVILQLVHRFTSAHAGADWLADDMNHGHLDYFFFLLAILQTVNLLLFFTVSRHYKYKGLIASSDGAAISSKPNLKLNP